MFSPKEVQKATEAAYGWQREKSRPIPKRVSMVRLESYAVDAYHRDVQYTEELEYVPVEFLFYEEQYALARTIADFIIDVTGGKYK
jgi:hypothetical protein